MRLSWIWTTAVLGLLLGLPASGRAGPVTYTFTPIFTTGSLLIPSGGSTPSINSAGTVVFRRSTRFSGDELVTGSGGPLTSRGFSGSSSFGPPVINAVEQIGYNVGFRSGAFCSEVRPGRYFGCFLGTDPYYGFASPALNDGGFVAFRAVQRDRGDGTPGPAIFLGNGGPLTTIASTAGGFFSNFGFFPSLGNSNQGTVAFQGILAGGGEGIYLGSGGPFTTIADTSGGRFTSFGVAPSLNELGQVAFFATLTDGSSGIFLAHGGTIETIADTTGPFSGFGVAGIGVRDTLTVNNAGQVVFLATLDAGGSGIFTGPDPLTDRVIGTGDPLFGSTVTGLELSREVLNDAGQIAFEAILADSRRVVIRADPAGMSFAQPAGITVPEPGGLVLLGVGALAGYGLLRKQANQRRGSSLNECTVRPFSDAASLH